MNVYFEWYVLVFMYACTYIGAEMSDFEHVYIAHRRTGIRNVDF
jgi:hypothetical protein